MNTSEAMKKNILTLCLLFTCIWGNSQTFQLEAANADSTDTMLPLNISLFDDDRFGFAHFSFQNGAYAAVSKHTADGAVEWCKRIIPENGASFEGGRVLATSDGGFLMAGDIEEEGVVEEGVGISKISPGGTLEWSYLFPDVYINFVGAADNLIISETAEGYLLGISNILIGLDNIVLLELDNQGILQAGYKLFVDNFNHFSISSFDIQEQEMLISANVFEGVSGNYTATGSIRLAFDFESGSLVQNHIYPPEYSIWDIAVDESGNQYCIIIEETSPTNYILVKYGLDGEVEWSRLFHSAAAGLSLSDEAVNVHYTQDELRGITQVDKQDGMPVWGKIFRNWHITTFGKPTAERTSDNHLLGLTLSEDAGTTILYRIEVDGSLPDCPPINRCDLEMPMVPPPPSAPVEVEIEPYTQQEPMPVALEEWPLNITPFCAPLQVPLADFTAENTACPGDSILVRAIPTEVPASSEWYAPGAIVESSSADSVVFQFPEPGTYQIRHIRTAFDCRDTFTKEVLIQQGPFFDLGPDTTFCAGDSLLLESGLPAGEYDLSWQDGSNAPSIWATTAGIYQLAATGNTGCVYEDEVLVSEAATPELDLGPDTAFCQGESYLLAPSTGSSNIEYRWSTNSDSPQLLITQPGTYALTLTDLESGCTAVDSIKIDSRTLPAYTFTPDTAFCPGRELTLAATSAATNLSFVWPDGTIGTAFQVDSIGSYRLIATDDVCTDTTSIEVGPGDCSVSIFVPNAFSPNGDGRNDQLRAFGPDVEIRRLRIFGRWGGMLFEEEGANAYWDGRVGGKAAGTGSYLYVLEYLNTLSLEEEQVSGVVYLVR